jgi:hypothetical protein
VNTRLDARGSERRLGNWGAEGDVERREEIVLRRAAVSWSVRGVWGSGGGREVGDGYVDTS